jgi:hypothetical protein
MHVNLQDIGHQCKQKNYYSLKRCHYAILLNFDSKMPHQAIHCSAILSNSDFEVFRYGSEDVTHTELLLVQIEIFEHKHDKK